MTKKQILYKLFRAFIIMGITFFFLIPFVLPFMGAQKKAESKSEMPIYQSPIASNTQDPYWDQQPVIYTSSNLGINLPWLDTHDGKETFSWLNTKYKSKLIENDLTEIEKMGVTKIRSFCQMESVFNYKNGKFLINETYAANLDDFLDRAERHGISVICIIGDGNYNEQPQDLDGHIRLHLLQTNEGLQVYKEAYITYINRFKAHKNILMWEISNEPYASLTWSSEAKRLQVTPEQVHTYLVQSYNTIKPLVGDTYVGFSDLEEEEQPQYALFSSAEKRKLYVDDCTDIYAMHIYRASAAQVADFRELTDKPKWVLEIGAYNYNDPDGIEHPIPAANELYNTEENYIAVVPIARKLVNSGFTLIMPWGFTSNSGMVVHNPNGTHTLKKLPLFIKSSLEQSK